MEIGAPFPLRAPHRGMPVMLECSLNAWLDKVMELERGVCALVWGDVSAPVPHVAALRKPHC